MAATITIEGVEKRFGSFTALHEVSLEIEAGEIFFLLGPSGCGKTTLLRCISGFNIPDRGRIFLGERDITHLPACERDTGMMFQSYALWPHLTLAENVAFGLEMRKVPRQEIKERVAEALERVHLGGSAQKRPNQLSGGQQQRVALARAMVVGPQCLLLDEPLSNLDARLRVEMRSEIRQICKQQGLTAIYVTHDQKEALAIADRVAVMREGRVEQVGTPASIYHQPANRFVAEFIGEGNFLECQITAESCHDGVVVNTRLGYISVQQVMAGMEPGTKALLCLRPEALQLSVPPGVESNVFEGEFLDTMYLGEIAQHTIAVQKEDSTIVLKIFELNPGVGKRQKGSMVRVWIDPAQVIITA